MLCTHGYNLARDLFSCPTRLMFLCIVPIPDKQIPILPYAGMSQLLKTEIFIEMIPLKRKWPCHLERPVAATPSDGWECHQRLESCMNQDPE